MISWLKSKAITLVDKLHFDPYEDFTRPFVPCAEYKSDTTPLLKMAERAEDLRRKFSILDERIIVNRIPSDGSIDTGDQAIWHGIYTGTRAIKYSVTQDPQDLAILEKCIRGLALHQPDGILCRGVKGINLEGIQYDASNDSATGHLWGLWMAWCFGDRDIKARCADLIGSWAAMIYEHGDALINPNGKPTTFGKLDQGILTDPLRITLLMAIYGAARTMTGMAIFHKIAMKVAQKHGSLIAFPKFRWAWLDNFNDTHRGAIHLRIMSDTGVYFGWDKEIREGMTRLFNIGYRQENAWICLLTGRSILPQPADIPFDKWIRGVLSEFSVVRKLINMPVTNIASDGKYTLDFNGWRSDVVKWGKQLVARQPLPIWARGSQDFIWQRHPYSVQDWQKHSNDSQHNSEDYLAVYWRARQLGILTAND